MKLELIKTQEGDGRWFKILEDGKSVRCFSFNDLNEDDVLKTVEAEFEARIKYAKPVTEVLKTVEI